MKVLGIETSCDETSAAVVRDGCSILSNQVSSSLHFHRRYGGVVPEIASRMQLETIVAVTDAALAQARCSLTDIQLISVTEGPGLLGSLLVGIAFAKAVGSSRGIPVIGVNHIHSHLYANFLGVSTALPQFPLVALIVSGGHTSLFYLRDFGHIQVLGQTQDDAAGEAFDKVAKLLGLGYPGGPAIERVSRKGNSRAVGFRCSGTVQPLDFSFSGIKTAVLYHVQAQRRRHTFLPRMVADTAASFQDTVITVLVGKALAACALKKVKTLVVGGGVAANAALRQRTIKAAAAAGIRAYFPPKALCMDNAAMVAGFGYQRFYGSTCTGPGKGGRDAN